MTLVAFFVKATKIKENYVAALWRMDPPLNGWEYVQVSASGLVGTTETYIFPADKTGKWLRADELAGSIQNNFNHKAALTAAGYAAHGPEPTNLAELLEWNKTHD